MLLVIALIVVSCWFGLVVREFDRRAQLRLVGLYAVILACYLVTLMG